MKAPDWFRKETFGETQPVPFQQMVIDEAQTALDRFGVDRRGYELKVVELPPQPSGHDHCVVYVKLRPVAVIAEALARFEAMLHTQLAAYGIVVRAVYWRVHA